MTQANLAPYDAPTAAGYFGDYGGRFVAETLMHALDELTGVFNALRDDAAFRAEFERDLAHYVGRPTPLYRAERLTQHAGGARICLKREDLNHTGAHKINNHRRPGSPGPAHGQDAHHRRGPEPASTASPRPRSPPAWGSSAMSIMGAEDIRRQSLKRLSHEAPGAPT